MATDQKISFRQGQQEDYPQLIDIRAASIKEGAQGFYRQGEIDSWIADGHYEHFIGKLNAAHVFVAEVEGILVGFVSWRGTEIDQAYINPAYFRRGIGARLLAMAEDDYKTTTHHSEIYVGASHNARDFYERNGYRFIEVRLTPKNTEYSYLEKRFYTEVRRSGE